MRVKIVKDSGKFRAGETVEVGNADAKELIESGAAELTKDMTQTETKTKSAAVRGKNGRFSSRRTN
jgi:uncharacterized phage infection (PIP) family protein YhgE